MLWRWWVVWHISLLFPSLSLLYSTRFYPLLTLYQSLNPVITFILIYRRCCLMLSSKRSSCFFLNMVPNNHLGVIVIYTSLRFLWKWQNTGIIREATRVSFWWGHQHGLSKKDSIVLLFSETLQGLMTIFYLIQKNSSTYLFLTVMQGQTEIFQGKMKNDSAQPRLFWHIRYYCDAVWIVVS